MAFGEITSYTYYMSKTLQREQIKKGNFLHFAIGNGNGETVYQVEENMKRIEGVESTIDGYPLDFFKPIELTPALMRQLGFVQRPGENAVQREEVIFLELASAIEGEYEYIINVEYGNGSTRIHILNYAHQLQNFYTEFLEQEIEIVWDSYLE